jgi:hypothetical protein
MSVCHLVTSTNCTSMQELNPCFHDSSLIATATIFIDSGYCYVGQWTIIKYDNKVTNLFLKPKQLVNF